MTSKELALDDPGRCPLCGGPNDCPHCSRTPHKGPCWCSVVDFPEKLLARVPEALRNRACVCSKCIESHQTQHDLQHTADAPPANEGPPPAAQKP